MTRAILLTTVLLAALIAAALVAATIDDSVADAKYVEYARGFAPYTAKLKVPCGERTCEASATLISDHWALTAAHVVEGAETAIIQTGEKAWVADRIVRHPESERPVFGKHDLALLHVAAGFGLDFYPPLSDGAEEVGDICSIAGYGICGKMSSGYDKADGKLRAGTNHIERFEGALIVCTASPRKSPLEICISPGDSGGPLFCRGKLAGVNCLTSAPKGPLKSRAGEESGHVRVSLYREWIDEVTK